ncbi:Os01g0860950 [Oryza sativa Japonica Group]|uniref:Os01g0860950 protein n=1 Tax=Oryza sativa subsp. japonica TaxID=39947 RepID=C7IX87_ORYSJ|nr:Os01g0860950 [Oryza sativa Japonica Group]|eukprot:NP_001172663.1 Os01g0860950 [Oryza sativa Japonica Group]
MPACLSSSPSWWSSSNATFFLACRRPPPWQEQPPPQRSTATNPRHHLRPRLRPYLSRSESTLPMQDTLGDRGSSSPSPLRLLPPPPPPRLPERLSGKIRPCDGRRRVNAGRMLAGRPKNVVAAAGAPAMRVELERDLAGMGLEEAPAADLGLVLPLVESSRSYIGFSSEKATSSPMGMVIDSGGKSGSGGGGGGGIRGGDASPLSPAAMTVSHDTFLSPAPAPATPHTKLSREPYIVTLQIQSDHVKEIASYQLRGLTLSRAGGWLAGPRQRRLLRRRRRSGSRLRLLGGGELAEAGLESADSVLGAAELAPAPGEVGGEAAVDEDVGSPHVWVGLRVLLRLPPLLLQLRDHAASICRHPSLRRRSLRLLLRLPRRLRVLTVPGGRRHEALLGAWSGIGQRDKASNELRDSRRPRMMGF